MKNIYILLTFFISIFNQTNPLFAQSGCINADFSLGIEGGGWTGSTGENKAGTYINPVSGFKIGAPNSVMYVAATGRHTLMTDPNLRDPFTENKLNVLPPNGAYSCRLGNPRAGANDCDKTIPEAEQMTYTYAVTESNCIFTYQYAIVLQDPTSFAHKQSEKPKFTIYVKDANGNIVDPTCGVYEVSAGAGIPGFVDAPELDGTCREDEPYVWKNWTAVSIDLRDYIGQNVSIEFTTYDCNPNGKPGGHPGYAYISCYCGSFSLTQQCVGTSDVVTAPEGFTSYQWTYTDNNGQVHTSTTTSNSITINPVPNGQTITCIMTPVTGEQCKITLTLPLSIDIPEFTPAAPTICEGQAAIITASGAEPYSYSWSTGSTNETINVSPDSTTSYTVTATAAGGCKSTANVTVTVNKKPTGPTQSTPANCDVNNGTLSVTPTTGTAPYTYTWSTNPNQYTQQISGLAPGGYTVTVTDKNGCSSTIVGTVNSSASIELATSSTNENCGHADGTAQVTATGGTPPLSYTWSTNPPQYTPSISGLSGGTYSVTVTDNICPAVTQVTIINYPNPLLQVTNVTNEKCNYGNGSITVEASGGTPAYSYIWNTTPVQISNQIQNIPAGTYIVTVIDQHQCTATQSILVSNSPPPTAVIDTVIPETCDLQNGSISVVPSGGTPEYTYTWNTNPTEYTDSVFGLNGGTYTVTITDQIGCTTTASGVVPESPGLTIIGTPHDETCTGLNNGSINITVSGGTNPMTYQWSNGATNEDITGLAGGITYIVTATDINSCSNTASFNVRTHLPVSATTTSTPEHCDKLDGTATVSGSGGTPPYYYSWATTPVQFDQTATKLVEGTYTVYVSDGYCETSATALVGFVEGPTSSTTAISAKCQLKNGGAIVTPVGGSPPYSYKWSSIPVQNSATLSGVYAGTYYVTVNDAYGCSTKSSVVITDTPVPTSIITDSVPANCGFNNGSISAAASGGTQPYTYTWNSFPVQTTATAINLPSGLYTITVSDLNGCVTTVVGEIPMIPGPKAVTTSTPELCLSGNGSATVSASGGIGGPYTYSWDTGETDSLITDLSSGHGIYTVIVSDGGCTALSTVSVGNIPGPTAHFIASPTYLTIMSGPVYFLDQSTGNNITTWNWTLGDGSTASVEEFEHLYPDVGTYPVQLIITDINLCKDTAVDTIIVRDIFTIYIPNCFTPTDNDVNDTFFPEGVNWDMNYFEMYIFDRWGNIMFKSFDVKNKYWNGTLNNEGTIEDVFTDVYVYLIRVKELNGPKHEYFGRVTLLK